MFVDYGYSAGDTEVNMAEQYWGTNGTMHLSTGYDYLTSLDFVDQDNIGAGGHSMGSLYSYRLALHRKVNVVVSDVIFFDDLPDYDFNFVQLTAIHDEGILSRVSTYEDVYKDPLLTGLFGETESNLVNCMDHGKTTLQEYSMSSIIHIKTT